LRRLLPCLVLALSLAPVTGGRADAAEITVVIGSAEPGRDWGTSYGGILTITLFNIVGAELEGIWQGGELAETSIFTLSAKAYVGPTLGAVVPYIGLAAGVYRESLPGVSDQGTLGAFFLGAKLKFPLGLVLRGEYQWVELPSEVALPMDTRYFFGVGLSF
jgi:hypothetical protein